jgi:hypothetical protein
VEVAVNETLPQTEHLSVSESWALLSSVPAGRLAVIVDGKPEIFPVNHVVDHDTVVFRTDAGTKLLGSLGKDVAYEADGLLEAGALVWSVVVKGRASEVARLPKFLESLELPLVPWHTGPKPRIIRIQPEEVHGRRFAPRLRRHDTSGHRTVEE